MEETASVWNSSTFNTDTNQKGQLTVRIIKDAKPKDKIYRLGDSNGLCLEVTPSGSKLWRLRYYFEGKAKMIGLGAFPETSLNKARKIRNEQQQTLKKGIDPSKERQKQQVNTKEVQEQAKIINKIDTLIRQLRNSKKSFKATTEPAE
ncbi:Arm DNA-binding domain-containing protein [Maridesulfovibrio frigidus]|uniref:Arm DNA-binding domain-containing protein n=1 Tax=Maridesulfovibrio frigidus TaxID=340956 RepID=UPI0012EB5603|nr:Arm DNA-binding domain-containing protein [Maridesulfovibrio frigidus]